MVRGLGEASETREIGVSPARRVLAEKQNDTKETV